MSGRASNWNTLTIGLYKEDNFGVGIRAVVTEKFTGTLSSYDTKIIVHKYDEVPIEFTIYNDDLQPVDVSLSTFKFRVKEKRFDRIGKILFEKSGAGEIEVADAENGKVTVLLDSQDTRNMKTTVEYLYDMEIRSTSNRLIIIAGDFIVREM